MRAKDNSKKGTVDYESNYGQRRNGKKKCKRASEKCVHVVQRLGLAQKSRMRLQMKHLQQIGQRDESRVHVNHGYTKFRPSCQLNQQPDRLRHRWGVSSSFTPQSLVM